jgi:ectoine hydroxylase-related dioxygenase (phytanoyl-CoA dioxygenase family)
MMSSIKISGEIEEETHCSIKAMFVSSGYVILNLSGQDELIDEIVFDMNEIVRSGEYRTNSGIYSYNDSPRIVEAWRKSRAIHRLAFHPAIIEVTSRLYGSKPRPFSTINFLRSTQQPLHSDYVHFGTVPHYRLAAAWVALQDIDPDSGPLQVVPGSHHDPLFCYSDLGLKPARSLSEVKDLYSKYENFVISNLSKPEYPHRAVTPPLSKGDVLIWDANLLHGSPVCKNNKLSRLSQVTHYHFDDVEIFYNPSFSQPKSKKFVRRNVEFIPEDVY